MFDKIKEAWEKHVEAAALVKKHKKDLAELKKTLSEKSEYDEPPTKVEQERMSEKVRDMRARSFYRVDFVRTIPPRDRPLHNGKKTAFESWEGVEYVGV